MPTITKLSSETINLDISKEFTTARLTQAADKTYFQIIINVTKLGGQKAISGAFMGFLTGVAWKTLKIGMDVFFFKRTEIVFKETSEEIGKKAIKKTINEVGKEILVDGAIGALMKGTAEAIEGIFDASKDEYNFYINPVHCSQFCQEVTDSKEIIEAFLQDPSFIDKNAAYEIKDPISQQAIVHPLKTPCNHYFNAPHIIKWINKKNNCPTCRSEIKTTEDLKFSWEISLKIIKVIRAIIARLDQPSENPLPPNLTGRNIKVIRETLEPLNQHCLVLIDIIDRHVTQALREAKKQEIIDDDYYDRSIVNLDHWKKSY